ncbi:MAG: sensor histidine kinase [Agathobacter sp.]
MQKRKMSLTWRLIFTMVGIVAGTVLLCCLFNNTFLEKFYIYHKEQALRTCYRNVFQICEKSDYTADQYDVAFERLCSDNNINMLITNADKVLVWTSYSNAQRFQMQMDDWIYGTDRSKIQVLYSGKDYTLVRQTDERLQSEYLVLLGKLNDGGRVYVRAAVESIRESASITNRFFVSVSAGMILFSILLIVIFSRSISHPLQALSDLSKRMSRLDFDAKFVQSGHGTREIDELGQSMNELSETLEKTISELKTANISLTQDIEKKEQIDEMRKEFLSNVSHELKTPLALIQGYAEGLSECINDDPESREFYCDVIMDETEKMNHMVRQLLDLNQLEFGNDKVEMTRFNLTELIDGVIASSGIMAQQKQAQILFDPQGPVYVWGDEFKVEQVITNYLTNAINHVDKEKRITISFRYHDNLVRTSVFNTGEQIPEEELDKIWIKFYKVDKARTREYGGSGIGLSIVQAIMDSLHQKCGVINHPDGVEFWMELESNH